MEETGKTKRKMLASVSFVRRCMWMREECVPKRKLVLEITKPLRKPILDVGLSCCCSNHLPSAKAVVVRDGVQEAKGKVGAVWGDKGCARVNNGLGVAMREEIALLVGPGNADRARTARRARGSGLGTLPTLLVLEPGRRAPLFGISGSESNLQLFPLSSWTTCIYGTSHSPSRRQSSCGSTALRRLA